VCVPMVRGAMSCRHDFKGVGKQSDREDLSYARQPNASGYIYTGKRSKTHMDGRVPITLWRYTAGCQQNHVHNFLGRVHPNRIKSQSQM
jgi:hypothetical protein